VPNLRFKSGSKDETRSQCLDDNGVFDQQPQAAIGKEEEACGEDGQSLNFCPAGVGRRGRGRTPRRPLACRSRARRP
jgi:hypothetical protein